MKSSAQTRINYQRKNVPLKDALEAIGEQAGYHLFFIPIPPAPSLRINVKFKDVSPDSAFRVCLRHTGWSYKIVAQTVFIRLQDSAGNIVAVNPDTTVRVSELDQEVVIGYGSTTQRKNTGDIVMVGARDLSLAPVSNPLAALEGWVPGLVITQSNGLPGAGFTVLLRGQNSLAQGAQPFFVIDGVPFASLNNSLSNISSGLAANALSPFSMLDPYDIESITVLKDADATAIYGSRGANGVILITTKRGKEGKTQLDFHLSTGFSRPTTRLHLMNTPEYLQMRREAFKNDGLQPNPASDPDLLQWDTTRYTDFQHLLTGAVAHTLDADLSVSGGVPRTRYLLAGTYHNESTVFPGNFGEQRESVLGDIFHSSEDGRLTLQLSELAVNDENKQLIHDLSAYGSLTPNAPALTGPGGQLVWTPSFTNPLGFLQHLYDATTDNVLVHGQLSYKLQQQWSLQVSTGYNYIETSENSRIPIAGQNPVNNPTGSVFTATTSFKSWIIEPQTDYTDTLWKKGVLNLMAGMTLQSQREDVSALSATGFVNDALLNDIYAAQQVRPSELGILYRYDALFGRINCQWDRRYLLNVSLRRDGSSRFGPGRQFGNFGAVGLGWVFSRSAFFLDQWNFLSYGKLRASWGVTGNDQIGDYSYLGTWSGTTTVPYQGMTGFYSTGLYNPDAAWETIRKLEAGLELGFFGDKLLFNAAWYRNRSTNQLIKDALPGQTGFGTVLQNVGAVVQNAGLEMSLESHNITGRKWSWTTRGNISFSRNKLVAWPGLASSSYAGQLVIGESIHVLMGYTNLGVDPGTGVYRFRMDPATGLPEQGVIGSPDLHCSGGLQNSLRYRSWQLDVLLEGRVQTGNSALTNLYRSNPPGMQGIGLFSNQPTAFLRRWQEFGDEAPYQRYTTGGDSAAEQALPYYNSSEAILADASFIRLKTLSLSWQLPDALLKRLHAGRGTVFVRAQNLLTWTHYQGGDPENQNPNSLPPLKTISIGIEFQLK